MVHISTTSAERAHGWHVTTPVLSARGFQEGREAMAISLVYVFSSFPIIYGKPCALDFYPWKSPTTADIHTGGLSGICSRRVHTDLSLLRETHKMEHYSAQKKRGKPGDMLRRGWGVLEDSSQHREPDPEGHTASEFALTPKLQKVGSPRAWAKGLWQEELNVLKGCGKEPRRSMRVMEEKRSTTD